MENQHIGTRKRYDNEFKIEIVKLIEKENGSSKKRVGKQKYIAINVSRLECNNIVTFYPGVLWN